LRRRALASHSGLESGLLRPPSGGPRRLRRPNGVVETTPPC
jgi:hypothetical protein